jgi:hypothetical protein
MDPDSCYTKARRTPAIQRGPVRRKDEVQAGAVELTVTVRKGSRAGTSVEIALHCITGIIFFVCVELLATNIDPVKKNPKL